MDAGRVLHATLDLLDRQLRDRDGVLCGNVDDLEIRRSDDSGVLFVSAILTGAGALSYRMARRRVGRWLHEATLRLGDDERDRGRVPMELVMQIGPAIDLAVDAADLANHDMERWLRDHVIGKIPGSSRRARH